MVRDRQQPVDDSTAPVPPRMLTRPSEPAPPLGRLGDTPQVQVLRQIRATRRSPATFAFLPRRSMRAWLARVSGRSDRRLLEALAETTDAVAERCDLLADRLHAQELVTFDITRAYGEELANLRADIVHLRRVVGPIRESEG